MSVEDVDIAAEMQVEAELCDELKECLYFNEAIGQMSLKHPLRIEAFYLPQLNNHYNKSHERKKQYIAEALEERNRSMPV